MVYPFEPGEVIGMILFWWADILLKNEKICRVAYGLKKKNENKGDVELTLSQKHNKKKQSENSQMYDCNPYIVCSESEQ